MALWLYGAKKGDKYGKMLRHGLVVASQGKRYEAEIFNDLVSWASIAASIAGLSCAGSRVGAARSSSTPKPTPTINGNTNAFKKDGGGKIGCRGGGNGRKNKKSTE